MVPEIQKTLFLDPIEELDENLAQAWRVLGDYFDASGEMPGVLFLFEGVDIRMPDHAAEMVIANMLTDLIELISRFSPWYTRPARAFGLCTIRDMKSNCIRWVLAPEAVQKWESLILPLADSIERNSGFIQAMLYVERLMADESEREGCVTAQCSCLPPHTIQVNKTVLDKMEIYCNVCKLPFS